MKTHDELVVRASRWLKNSQRCSTVLSELTCMANDEIPDAIGFLPGNGSTILIECKTSLNDFRADKRKYFRQNPEIGMGVRRYYLTEKGLLKPNKLPEGWGLLEITPKQVRKKKESGYFTANKNSEIIMLLSRIRRLEEYQQR